MQATNGSFFNNKNKISCLFFKKLASLTDGHIFTKKILQEITHNAGEPATKSVRPAASAAIFCLRAQSWNDEVAEREKIITLQNNWSEKYKAEINAAQ